MTLWVYSFQLSLVVMLLLPPPPLVLLLLSFFVCYCSLSLYLPFIHSFRRFVYGVALVTRKNTSIHLCIWVCVCVSVSRVMIFLSFSFCLLFFKIWKTLTGMCPTPPSSPIWVSSSLSSHLYILFCLFVCKLSYKTGARSRFLIKKFIQGK